MKLSGTKEQYNQIDIAIKAGQFIRNKCLSLWVNFSELKLSEWDIFRYCQILGKNYEFVDKLNAQARRASAQRAWKGILKFYSNCRNQIPGKKGYPKFKNNSRSIEYIENGNGYKISNNSKSINFTDKLKIGTLKLIGSRNLKQYSRKQIKRCRIIRKADGYYVQFVIDATREIEHEFNGNEVGIDMGLQYFYTDSNGNTIENPKFLQKSENKIKKLNRKSSRKKKGSNNRKKSNNKLARKHLKVSRQRKDFVVKTASALVKSNDFIVYENLQITNMVKNNNLAKSISDASWGQFLNWIKYYGQLHKIQVMKVSPHFTSQMCSNCRQIVKKSLSTRTHKCLNCKLELSRDENAAINILNLGKNSTEGHSGTLTSEEKKPLPRREIIDKACIFAESGTSNSNVEEFTTKLIGVK